MTRNSGTDRMQQPRSLELFTGSSSPLRQAWTRGHIHRLLPGVYVRRHEWDAASPWVRRRALCEAVRVLRPDAVFAASTALMLRGLPVLSTPPLVEVLVAGDRSRKVQLGQSQPEGKQDRPSPLVVHEQARSAPVEVEGPWRLESVASAAAFAVSRMKTVRDEAVVMLDGARQHLQSDAPLLDAAQSLPSACALARFKKWWDLSDPRSESAGETMSRLAMADLGFLAPLTQVELEVDGRAFRLDFLWPHQRLVGEYDGDIKYEGHDAAEVRRAEKERQALLERAGYRVIRWGWKDLRSPGVFGGILAQGGVPPASSPYALRGQARSL